MEINTTLSAVSQYHELSREVKSLEFRKVKSASALQNLVRNTKYHSLCYDREMMKLSCLRQEMIELESTVERFKNNDEDYLKIKKLLRKK